MTYAVQIHTNYLGAGTWSWLCQVGGKHVARHPPSYQKGEEIRFKHFQEATDAACNWAQDGWNARVVDVETTEVLTIIYGERS